MKKLSFLGLLIILGVVGVIAYFWDGMSPAVTFPDRASIGAKGEIAIAISDEGRGLIAVTVDVVQGGKSAQVFSEASPKLILPWQGMSESRVVTLQMPEIQAAASLEQGPFDIVVKVEDQPNLFFFSRETEATKSLVYDRRPPALSPISTQHYLHQGGSEGILYSVSEPGPSGVRVGERIFRGFPVPGKGEGVHLALFALGYDESPDSSIALWAEDEAGNYVESGFWCKVFPERFRQRQIEVTDQFISSVMPGILSNSPDYSEQATPIETFLLVNGKMRVENNRTISEISQKSSPEILWREPFLQLSNSQVEAVFADRRSYMYNGQKRDEQTHLGFDLASLAQSDVEASNDGTVVFADYLGIYGNLVILDHGMGLGSLYGHLSMVNVEVGQQVVRGQALGRTGSTGLAGGDHLHFSMLLQGVQVNPIEWWDAKWVTLHVLDRVRPD